MGRFSISLGSIIGMDIITRGNFHLDCDHGETLLSFELPNE